MPAFEATFKHLRGEFTAKTKRAFLDDIQGQIEDDENIQEILRKRRRTPPEFVTVTFDRQKNDSNFSYSDFDLLLVVLDHIAGGDGIKKPSNQVRALRWNGSRPDLLQVLRVFRGNNSQVRFRRALILNLIQRQRWGSGSIRDLTGSNAHNNGASRRRKVGSLLRRAASSAIAELLWCRSECSAMILVEAAVLRSRFLRENSIGNAPRGRSLRISLFFEIFC
jgi:hypothetical protein